MQEETQYEAITKEAFHQWRVHPMTQIFFAFLQDNMQQSVERITSGVIQGKILSEEILEHVSLSCRVAQTIINTREEDINNFYKNK